jgi:glutathione synthase/RimK-type ligase-like ATP-grasp enzyme
MNGSIINLEKMMARYNQLILKPVKGSEGRGIMKLSKNAFGTWFLQYPLAKRKWSEITFNDEIPDIIIDSFNKKQYMIQEKIELATYNERPFDLRVVVQRNYTGNWVVAGILCKVSPSKEQFVTNISQGGRSLSFDSVLASHPSLSYKKAYDDISRICLKMAKHLEKYTDHIADIAFDIALNKEGNPYFIESNFRGRYGQAKYSGKRYDEWKAKHFNPIGYGRYLMDRSSKQP